jgi:hypothetical protein
MSIKKKLAVGFTGLALAAGATLGVAAPASAVYAGQGPYSAPGACNADRSHFVNYYPQFRIGPCVRDTGGWWFTVLPR